MNLLSLASHQLRKAADLVDKIENLNGELSSVLGSSSTTTETLRRKNRMSDAGRLAIAAAQKARWSKVKTVVKPGKAKRTMSAAARAKIAAAARKRWAKAKAAGKSSL